LIEIDETDRQILRALIKNTRSKLTSIAKECEISSTAVKNRIERLKKNGVIVNSILIVNMASFGYPYTALIGVNLDINEEDKITNLVRKHTKVAGIDRGIGRYDLCLFVFTQSIQKMDELKLIIRKQKGVSNIEINIWKKLYQNYSNIKL